VLAASFADAAREDTPTASPLTRAAAPRAAFGFGWMPPALGAGAASSADVRRVIPALRLRAEVDVVVVRANDVRDALRRGGIAFPWLLFLLLLLLLLLVPLTADEATFPFTLRIVLITSHSPLSRK
jgi:hypothetical protein